MLFYCICTRRLSAVFYTTVTHTHTDLPEFTAVALLDGQQFMSYSNGQLILRDWINISEGEDFWSAEMHGKEETLNQLFSKVKTKFHHTTGK